MQVVTEPFFQQKRRPVSAAICWASRELSYLKQMGGRCFFLVPRGVCSNGSSAFLTKLSHAEEVPTNTWCIKLMFGESVVVHLLHADSVL